MISLEGLDKADVLAALYNASRPLGMGFLAYDPAPMTHEQAAEWLQKSHYFDYLNGRVMKVDLKGDTLNPFGYDRDNGAGAAACAIDALRTGNTAAIQQAHRQGVLDAAERAKRGMAETTEEVVIGGAAVIRMGLDDVKDVLGPKVDEAVRSA